MRIIVDRQALSETLAFVRRASNPRPIKPILGCVRLSAENGLDAECFDGETRAKRHLDRVDVMNSGVACVDATRLHAVIGQDKSQTVTIETIGGGVHVTTDTGKYSLGAGSPESWPESTLSAEGAVDITGGTLLIGLQSVIAAAGVDGAKYGVRGVHFDGDSMVATDGHRILARRIKASESVPPFTIPFETAKLLLSAKPGESVRIEFCGYAIRFAWDDCVVESPLVDAKFPPWRDAIPKGCDRVYESVNPRTMGDAVKRAAIFTDKTSWNVRLEVKDGTMTIRAASSELGSGDETMACGGPDTLNGVKPEYLVSLLESAGSDLVTLKAGKTNKPLMVEAFGGDYVGVVAAAMIPEGHDV